MFRFIVECQGQTDVLLNLCSLNAEYPAVMCSGQHESEVRHTQGKAFSLQTDEVPAQFFIPVSQVHD